jgi:hypothetical protein
MSDVMKQEWHFHPHSGELQIRHHQPSRDAIMEYTARRRIEGVTRKTDGLRLALTIPLVDLEQLHRKYPELKARDAMTRKLAWDRFIASAESAPYRVF